MRLYRVSTGYSEVSNESLSVLNESLGRGRGKNEQRPISNKRRG